MAIKMIAPAGLGGLVQGSSGVNYQVASDGSINNVLAGDVSSLFRASFRFFSQATDRTYLSSPLPADLISTVAAVTPSNVALTIAAQPPQPRKLQIRLVLGTPGTTNITAGTLTLVGVDQDGNVVTEVLQMATAVSVTLKSANAYASLTSATVAGYTASGSGTGNTIGLGPSNDFGMPTVVGVVGFAVAKVTKITKVLGTSNVAADDVASTATVDAVARTIAPTTAPAANGLVDYDMTYTYGLPG
jgi:hypothetical protein